jgi:transcriptional regulator of acetoin/glycerol metabolism
MQSNGRPVRIIETKPVRGRADESSALVPAIESNGPEMGAAWEREALLEALRKCSGNKAQAARLLGLPRSTYFSKLKKHRIS